MFRERRIRLILKIENLSKSFGNHEVLKNVNLAMDKGEIIAVIGSSGSGKSKYLCISTHSTNLFTFCIKIGRAHV